MKTYEKMAQNALIRIGQYEAEQKKRRKKAVRIAYASVSFCLVAILGFGALKSGIFRANTPIAEAENTKRDIETDYLTYNSANNTSEVSEQVKNDTNTTDKSDANGQVIITDDYPTNNNEQKGTVISGGEPYFYRWKDGLNMNGALYYAIEENPDSEFAVNAVYRPTTAYVTSFTYEGKTLSELAIDAYNERMLPEKMTELLKCGDDLKYGTALYETGTPSGEKWDKRLYEEKVAYFGEELLRKYIVDGIFLRDSLEKDIADFSEKSANEKYKQAFNAYMETVLAQVASRLSENNIKCERTSRMNNGLTVFVTGEELENLPLEDLEHWYFYLASDDIKGSTDYATDECGHQIVN